MFNKNRTGRQSFYTIILLMVMMLQMGNDAGKVEKACVEGDISQFARFIAEFL